MRIPFAVVVVAIALLVTVGSGTAAFGQSFTDDPLTVGTPVKAVHVTELRTAVANLRAFVGLPVFPFTDPTITPAVTSIRAVHVEELRSALNEVYDAAAKPHPTYTDPTLAGVAIKAVHIQQLRAAVFNAINDAPSFTKGADQTVNEDAAAQTVVGWATNISAGPGESSQTVTFVIDTNNNPTLFSAGPSVASNGTLTYTPAANQNGVATVTLHAHDDGGTGGGGVDNSAAQSFTITVNAVNDAPSFTKGADETVLEDTGLHTVTTWATAISAGPNEAQTVTFNITGNTNTALFSVQPAVASNGTLTYTLAANAFGASTITLTLSDDGGTANGGVNTSPSQSFTISVTSVNDAPSFTKGADQTVNEDAGAQSLVGWATAISAGPANEAAQVVDFVIDSNTNTGLFSAGPSVAANGTLTYTPAANQNGVATITLHIHDNGGTANGGVDASATQSFMITVNAVNDAPVPVAKSFTAQANMQITGLTGFLTGVTDADHGINGCVANTFTLVGVGATSPAGGTVTITNPTTGVVTFDPPPGVTGAVTFSYTVQDTGCPLPALTGTATATVTVSGPVIWFVNPAVAGPGDGRLSNPFKFLSGQPGAADDANDVDASGHRIFVYSGTISTGITLNSNEWLIGQGAVGASFDSYFGLTVPGGTMARPPINGTNPNVNGSVGFATSDKIDGLDMDGASTTLTGSSVTSFIINVGRFRRTGSSAATAISLGGTGNTGTFDFKSVTVTGTSGSSLSKGVSVSNLTGHFTVAGTDTALTPDGGTVSGYGGNGMEFISVANAGATSVSLTNMTITGNGQSQSVAGSASTCGGSLITSNNLSCVSNLHLQSVNTVSLTTVSVTNSGQMGINGNSVTALTITGSTITGNGNESFENGLTFQNLLGTCSITDTMMKDNAASQIVVANIANSSTLTLGITGTRTNSVYPLVDTSTTEIGKTTQTNTFTDQSLLINTVNTSSNVDITLNVTGVVFKNSMPGNSMLLNPNSGAGSSFNGTTTNTSFYNTAGGVIIQGQNAHDVTYNVTNSEFNRVNLQSILYAGLNPYTGTMQGTVTGNHIGEDMPPSGPSAVGVACEPNPGNCVGIDVNFIGGSGSISTRIQNNGIQQVSGSAIRVTANGTGTPQVNANIVTNTIQNPAGLVASGINTNIGTTSGANVNGCLGITGNTITGTYEDPGVGQLGIHTRVRFLSTHRLPGLAGGGTTQTPATAQAFIDANNGGDAGKVFSEGSGVPGYVGGVACVTP